MRTFPVLGEPFGFRVFDGSGISAFISGGKRSIVSAYYLYDKFNTDRAAGSVNATNAEPVGGVRTVTDTNGKISITGGVLDFATGVAPDDGSRWPSLTRLLGRTLLTRAIWTSGVSVMQVGFTTTTSGATIGNLITFNETLLRAKNTATNVLVGPGTTTAIARNYAIVLRTTGAFYFIKGDTYTNWSLLWVSLIDNTSTLYPIIAMSGAVMVGTADNIRVPKTLFIPVPLQSDGFSAATTDGAGNAEANGAVGNAYTNVGTWGVAAGVRSCSVLSGADGKSYLPCSSSNVLIDAVCTRSAGVTGIVARYVDAENYLIAYLDGTNAKLDKVVAGVTTSLISAAVTYGAGFVLRLVLDGTSARLFYNNLAVGTVATTPAAGSLNHGLYTTDTGATFDNLIVWARGNEGQYSGLDSL